MQQPGVQDATFVCPETPHTPMHTGSVAIYDPSTAQGGFVRFIVEGFGDTRGCRRRASRG